MRFFFIPFAIPLALRTGQMIVGVARDAERGDDLQGATAVIGQNAVCQGVGNLSLDWIIAKHDQVSPGCIRWNNKAYHGNLLRACRESSAYGQTERDANTTSRSLRCVWIENSATGIC